MRFFFFYSKHQAFSSWYVCIIWLSITKSVNIFSNKYKWNIVPIWNEKLRVRCFTGCTNYDTRLNANILIMVLHFSEQFYIKTTVLWAVFNDVLLPAPHKVPDTYKLLMIFQHSTSFPEGKTLKSPNEAVVSDKLEPAMISCDHSSCCPNLDLSHLLWEDANEGMSYFIDDL